MKKALFLLSLVSLVFTQSISAQFFLTLDLKNMDVHVGQRFEMRVIDQSDSTEVGRQVIKEIVSSAFSVDLFVLLENHSYTVDFYADLNGNGAYDAPPVDHAWRRVIGPVVQDVVINFSHVTIFTDIAIPAMFDLSYYEATWGGRWMNLTFSSTDTIQSEVQIACDSFIFSSITSGLFGNPDTVQFELRDTVPNNFDPSCDTMTIELTAPLAGALTLVNGMMSGDFLEPGTGIGLRFTGNYGAGQQMFQYMVFLNGVEFANGFSYVRELQVHSEIPALTLTIIEKTDVACAELDDGAVTLGTEGGVEPITFDWSDGGTGISRMDLAGGSYFITATDANGCTDSVSVILTEPEVLLLSIVDTFAVSCFAGSDGALSVTAAGGCPPYFYSLDGFAFTVTPLFTDLEAGTYNVYVQDAKGCAAVETVEIVQPTELQPIIAVTHETSVGAQDGTASSLPVGGTPPYTLLWSTGETSDTIIGLSPGMYTLTVTDSNGCTVTDAVEVAVFACTLSVKIEGSSVICANQIVVLSADATTVPVTYIWQDGSTGSSVVAGPGTYRVTVTDETGCTAADTIVVSEFDPVVVDNIEVVHEQGGNSDGSIEVDISGGQPPFVYAWTKDGIFFSSDQDLTDLSAGVYCLGITDSNGCATKTDTITVENTTSVIDLSQHFRVYPNPASSFIRIESDIASSVRMIDSQGREVKDLGVVKDDEISVRSLNPGVYFLIFSDAESVLMKKVVVQI